MPWFREIKYTAVLVKRKNRDHLLLLLFHQAHIIRSIILNPSWMDYNLGDTPNKLTSISQYSQEKDYYSSEIDHNKMIMISFRTKNLSFYLIIFINNLYMNLILLLSDVYYNSDQIVMMLDIEIKFN